MNSPHALLAISVGLAFGLATAPPPAAADIEGHCVANCGDDGDSGGSGGGGGGWSGGETYTAPAAPTPQQRAYHANERGVASYNAGRYGDALAAFQEALALASNDPVIQQNVRNAEEQIRRAQEQAMKDADRQRKEAATSASIREGINRLTSTLSDQNAAINVDGRAAGASNGATPPQPFVDANVVDLRDAKTLTVDPTKVSGPPAPPSLEFMDLHDAVAPALPSSAIASSTAMDTMVNFALGLPFDHDQFLQIPQEHMQQFIDNIQKNPTAFNNAILRKELEAADRAGEPSPYVELEILSRDPTLHDRVEAVRDRVRNQELNACLAANHRAFEDGRRAVERITRQLGYDDHTDYRVLEADPRFQQAVHDALAPIWHRHDVAKQRANARAERELNVAAKQLRGKTSLDVEAETRKLRKEYLHLHDILEH